MDLLMGELEAMGFWHGAQEEVMKHSEAPAIVYRCRIEMQATQHNVSYWDNNDKDGLSQNGFHL